MTGLRRTLHLGGTVLLLLALGVLIAPDGNFYPYLIAGNACVLAAVAMYELGLGRND